MSNDYFTVIRSYTLEHLADDEDIRGLRRFLRKGTPEQLVEKLETFRSHLHDCFAEEVKRLYNFDQSGDVDSSQWTGIEHRTPDLFDIDRRVFGEVSITYDKQARADEKVKKYSDIIKQGFDLELYLYDVWEARVYFTRIGKDLCLKRMNFVRFPEDVIKALSNGMTMYKDAQEFIEYETDETQKKIIPDPGSNNHLCSEAQLFLENDHGILQRFLDFGSFDSNATDQQRFQEEVQDYIKEKALEIAIESRESTTDFRATEEDSIVKAFEEVEKKSQEKYVLLDRAKPSCHGLPAEINKVPPDVDTRDHVIQGFLQDLEGVKDPNLLEILTTLRSYEEKAIPKMKQKMVELKFHMDREVDEEKRNRLKNKYKVLERRKKWERNSVKFRKSGRIYKLMRIGQKDDNKKKTKVKTVPFWLDTFSADLKYEIQRKSTILLQEERCWTPHKEYKPKLKGRGRIYEKFIRSQLFQEIAMISQLCANILRLCTKPRKKATITTCSNMNLMAIVGHGDGIMNDSVTVPIIWLCRSDKGSSLWMPYFASFNKINMSNGDRLNKSRLEQMVDAPRIAAIAASIISCEMEGTLENLLYACGLMASVAMSINIRDSELIDHIRYMVPNIFSERSCSVGYIQDKYDTPLKTKLQALVYSETKMTLRRTASLAKSYYEVTLENDVVTSGGTRVVIPFLECNVNSVFQLNGIVYTGFFSCKKGLHDPKTENKKMFDKICEFEELSLGKSLLEASFDPESYHFFDPEYMGYTMAMMTSKYCGTEGWRSRMFQMDNNLKPYQLSTFSSLRSSLKKPELLEEIRGRATKSKLRSAKYKIKAKEVSDCWHKINSDVRTRVVDQFWKVDKTIFQMAKDLIQANPQMGFYATWDQKRQRTGRDREVFILDPEGKTCMHNVESLFKMVCEGVPHEQITLPGNKKIISMNMKGALYFKKMKELDANGIEYENLRMTKDMTKWAPGDNVCKFIYAIAALPFLTRQEKIFYINLLCTSIRKEIVLNTVTTEAIGELVRNRNVEPDSRWAKLLGVFESSNGKVVKLSKNKVNIQFNWLMGVLNNTSSAVHAASAIMLKEVLKHSYKVEHYAPDVHSDDAAVDLIVSSHSSPKCPINESVLDFYPKAVKCNLKYCCIKLSDKKSYVDKHRKEFVSEVDDNGIMKSYWQKQAMAAISGLSYIDFYRDISEGCSKISNLISLGGPPTVTQVSMAAVVDLCRDTYSMLPKQVNDPEQILKVDRAEIPVELGGPVTMPLELLPIVGLRYQTFSRMMENLLEEAKVNSISDITEEILEDLKTKQANVFSSVWHATAEKAVEEQLVLDRLDTGLIRFKQFIAYEKTKELNIIKELKDVSKERIDEALELDPTLSIRGADSFEEQQLKLTMLVKNPRWYSSATLQSQGALKLDRMSNVRKPCCSPILDPDQPMEKGLKTIAEALVEAYNHLLSSSVTLEKTYAVLKSMPLMCYVYEVYKKIEFISCNKRVLFPVQKQPFLKGGMVSSSVVGLLQRVYTGKTKYSLDYNTLNEEIELVEMYREILKDMPKPEQAVAIYKIFQQSQGFSSVYFVPSPKYRGHHAIAGIICTQKSDDQNVYPQVTFEPPENVVFNEVRTKKKLNLSQRCSELACFFMRLCSAKEEAKKLFSQCRIEGKTVTEIIESSNNHAQIRYAQVLMGMHEKIMEPERDKLVFLKPQKRTIKGWEGPFTVYMNISNKKRKRGIILIGEDELIHSIYILGSTREYSDMKQKISIFMKEMNWRGNPSKHYLESTSADKGDALLLKFIEFGKRDFQTVYTREGKGLKVHCMPHFTETPHCVYSDITPYGVLCDVKFRELNINSRIMNQRITSYFPIENAGSLSIYPVVDLWKDHWDTIASGRKINVDFQMCFDRSKYLCLSQSKIDTIKFYGFDVEPAVTMNDDGYVSPFDGYNAQINFSKFDCFDSWSQKQFNLYLSLAIRTSSDITNWLSFKGALLGLAADFNFLPADVIRKFIKEGMPYNRKRDFTVNFILTHSVTGQVTQKIPKDIDDDELTGEDMDQSRRMFEQATKQLEETGEISQELKNMMKSATFNWAEECEEL